MKYFLLADNTRIIVVPEIRTGSPAQEWSYAELKADGMKTLSTCNEESWKDAAWAFRQEFPGGLLDAPQQPVRF